MLMSNLPLPDLVAKFVDGVTVHYRLETGRATLRLPEGRGGGEVRIDLGAPHHHRDKDDDEVKKGRKGKAKGIVHNNNNNNSSYRNDSAVARSFARHITLAQLSIEECLWRARWSSEEEEWNEAGEDDRTATNPDDIMRKGTHVVKEIVIRGETRDEWVEMRRGGSAAQGGDGWGRGGRRRTETGTTRAPTTTTPNTEDPKPATRSTSSLPW